MHPQSKTTTGITTQKLTQMAMLAAMSVVLVYFIHFPIFPAAPFLEYDPADIPLIIGAFLYGPLGGFLLTTVVCVVQGLTVSASSGIIGIFMHLAATGSYVLLAGLIYKRNKTRKTAVLSMLAGITIMTTTMIIWNIILTPIFMGVPTQAVIDMLLPVILPFNLLKAVVNSVLAFLVYKPIARFINH